MLNFNFSFRVKASIIKLKDDNISKYKTVRFLHYSEYNGQYIVYKERQFQHF